MAFRQWVMACSGPAANRMEGLCARLRDAVHDANDHDDEIGECGCGNDNDSHSIGHKSAMWRDLTMLSVREPAIPKVISVPFEDAMAISTMYSSLEDDSDSLVGLEILDPSDDERDGPSPNRVMMACVGGSPYWRPTAECSWTYSTASSHGQDLADFMKFDDGSSYSSISGKPPRPTPPPASSSRIKSHHKTKSGGTATTATSSWSRSNTWGGLVI